jgi:excisionase family DNA binding protein
MTGAEKGAIMHQYLGSVAAQVERQRLKSPSTKPPDSIIAFLLSLRRYLEAKEAAKILGCHRESLYLLISEQGLPAEKRGRRWRIDPIKFGAWLEARGFGPAATELPEKHQQEAPPNK